MERKYIYTLLTRFFENNFPKEIQDRFGNWFIREEHTAEKDQVLEEMWESLPVTTDLASFAELKKINKKIHPGPRLIYKRLAVIAAAILLPLLGILTTVGYYNYANLSGEIQIVECFVPNGERKQLFLSDGSTVWLNAGSILLYPEKFGNTRTLYLNGEGHFTVAQDEERPFVVKTAFIDVEALGTVFNVHAYANETTTTTTLESGKVRVDDKSGVFGSVILSPDEQLIYHHIDASFSKTKVYATRLSTWREGYLVFQQEPLEYIFRSLERRYNVKINYNNNKFEDMTFTIRFHADDTLEEAMKALNRIGGDFTYKIEEHDVYIQ